MTHPHRNGYAILIVLVAVAIVLILYGVQMKTLFVPDLPPNDTAVQERPWMLEELLAAEGDTVKLPRPPKPEFNEAFAVEAAVQRDGADRGKVTVGFKTSGRLQGRWNTRYTQNGNTYAITAEMEGNVDTQRTWEEAGRHDKSRLFFIGRGPYVRKTAGELEPDETGTAWMLGWLGADRIVTGHIALTTDQKRSAVYEFTNAGGRETANH